MINRCCSFYILVTLLIPHHLHIETPSLQSLPQLSISSLSSINAISPPLSALLTPPLLLPPPLPPPLSPSLLPLVPNRPFSLLSRQSTRCPYLPSSLPSRPPPLPLPSFLLSSSLRMSLPLHNIRPTRKRGAPNWNEEEELDGMDRRRQVGRLKRQRGSPPMRDESRSPDVPQPSNDQPIESELTSLPHSE